MTEEELETKLSTFLEKISEWSNNHSIIYDTEKSFHGDEEEVHSFLKSNPSEFINYDYEECQTNIFRLVQYNSYLNMITAREKSVKTWADQGFSYLMAGKVFEPYTKWEEKKFILVRSSRIGEKLQELSTMSESRILILEARMKEVESVIKIIENVARSKVYARP